VGAGNRYRTTAVLEIPRRKVLARLSAHARRGVRIPMPPPRRRCGIFVRCAALAQVTTAHLAVRFLKPGGLVVFTGASAALGPTPGMVGV